MTYDIKDSGKRREFKTGAVRDDKSLKGRFDLLPWATILDLAIHFQKGCNKYGDRNWEKGINLSEYFDSGVRHTTEAYLGFTDENHLIAAIWNLVCWYETKKRIEKGILPDFLDDCPYTYTNLENTFEHILAEMKEGDNDGEKAKGTV